MAGQRTEVTGPLITFEEGENLDGKEGHFLKLGATAGTVELAGLGEQQLVMVSKLKPGDKQINCRALSGATAKVVAGGAIAYGTEVQSDADGKAAAGAGGMVKIDAGTSTADAFITVLFT